MYKQESKLLNELCQEYETCRIKPYFLNWDLRSTTYVMLIGQFYK